MIYGNLQSLYTKEDSVRKQNMAIYDCFPFFNEMEILDLRFRHHYNLVDFFVIVESTKTFTGNDKPLYFQENKERYAPFLDKVIHIVVDDSPETDDFWIREHYQKDQIRRAFKSVEPNDLIIIADADELLRGEAISQALEYDGVTEFDMPMYQYYMNLCAVPSGWGAPYAIKGHMLESFPNLSLTRFSRNFKPDMEREGKWQLLENSGWHFTHLGGIERLKYKYLSYSHKDDSWPSLMSGEGSFEKHIAVGGVVGNFFQRARFVPIDKTFPDEIRFNQKYYQEIGFIKDIYEACREMQDIYYDLRIQYACKSRLDNTSEDALFSATGEQFLAFANVQPPYPNWNAVIPPFPGRLISHNARVMQSSVSAWAVGKTPEEDAKGAVNGYKDGGFGFHTEEEDHPWLLIDLGEKQAINGIRIYNRLYPYEIAARAANLCIAVGDTPDKMVCIYKRYEDTPFGGVDGKPLELHFNPNIQTRYVRIFLPNRGTLHLDQVEIFGP